MKHRLMLLGLVAVPALVGAAVYWQRTQALPRQVALARAAVGTRRADALLDGLRRLAPHHAEVAFLAARQHRLFGRLDAALATLNQAADLGWPEPRVARERLLLLAQTEFQRAEPKLVAELDKDPYDAEVLLALAQGYRQLGYLKRAETVVSRLLERDADNGAALWLRGKINWEAERRARLDLAKQDLEKALAVGPGQYYEADARLVLAQCELDLGRHERALELFRQCRAEDPGHVAPLYGIGEAAGFLGRWDEARGAYEELLRRRPGDVPALMQLAYIHEQRGAPQEALELLEEAEERDPQRYQIHYQMARVLRALGQTRRADEYQKRYEQRKKVWMGQQDESPAPAGRGGAAAKPPGG